MNRDERQILKVEQEKSDPGQAKMSLDFSPVFFAFLHFCFSLFRVSGKIIFNIE
jgi:hypothetical protein